MPKAPGIPFEKFMKALKVTPNNQALQNRIKQAYRSLGASMARFYKKYKKANTGIPGQTRLHGDLHQGNIFYVPINKQVVLIDNERLANTLIKGRSVIDKDLAILFIKSLFVVKWTTNGNFLKNFPFTKWFNLILPSFIEGFLSIYPKSMWKDIFKQLRHGISTYEEKKDDPYYTNKKELGFSVKDVMEPIFKKLEKKYQ